MELSKITLHVTIIVACLPALIVQVAGQISCYQCNSTLDHNCQEYFDHNNPNIPLRATPCKMYNARYCIKTTGLWGGIVGTHRFCSSRDLGDQCQDMRFPDHSRKYRGCIYTCGSDGCNTATSLFSLSAAVLSSISVLFALLCR